MLLHSRFGCLDVVGVFGAAAVTVLSDFPVAVVVAAPFTTTTAAVDATSAADNDDDDDDAATEDAALIVAIGGPPPDALLLLFGGCGWGVEALITGVVVVVVPVAVVGVSLGIGGVLGRLSWSILRKTRALVRTGAEFEPLMAVVRLGTLRRVELGAVVVEGNTADELLLTVDSGSQSPLKLLLFVFNELGRSSRRTTGCRRSSFTGDRTVAAAAAVALWLIASVRVCVTLCWSFKLTMNTLLSL